MIIIVLGVIISTGLVVTWLVLSWRDARHKIGEYRLDLDRRMRERDDDDPDGNL